MKIKEYELRHDPIAHRDRLQLCIQPPGTEDNQWIMVTGSVVPQILAYIAENDPWLLCEALENRLASRIARASAEE